MSSSPHAHRDHSADPPKSHSSLLLFIPGSKIPIPVPIIAGLSPQSSSQSIAPNDPERQLSFPAGKLSRPLHCLPLRSCSKTSPALLPVSSAPSSTFQCDHSSSGQPTKSFAILSASRATEHRISFMLRSALSHAAMGGSDWMLVGMDGWSRRPIGVFVGGFPGARNLPDFRHCSDMGKIIIVVIFERWIWWNGAGQYELKRIKGSSDKA